MYLGNTASCFSCIQPPSGHAAD